MKQRRVYNKKTLLEALSNRPELMQICEELFDRGNWIQVPKALIYTLDIKEAVLLSYLAGHAKKVRHDEKGFAWFYCTQTTIERELNISVRVQSKLFKRLKDKKYVVTRMQTGCIPAKRLIWIRWEKVAEDLVRYSELKSQWDEERRQKRKTELELLQEMEKEEDDKIYAQE